jgi:hypothetical protein
MCQPLKRVSPGETESPERLQEQGIDLVFKRINYKDLNSRQKESYNFQKVSGALADVGFVTIRLSDDWKGADFLARHIDGTTLLNVQLKTRFSVYEKYCGKDIWICFREGEDFYLYPHDVMLDLIKPEIEQTVSWIKERGYNSVLTKRLSQFLLPYKLS